MADPIPEADLREMRERCDAATAEPWKSDKRYIFLGLRREKVFIAETDPLIRHFAKNAHFIAHARTDMPRLLDEVDKLREGLRDSYWESHTGECLFLDDDIHALPQDCTCGFFTINARIDALLGEGGEGD
jgi:hypothetical protein